MAVYARHINLHDWTHESTFNIFESLQFEGSYISDLLYRWISCRLADKTDFNTDGRCWHAVVAQLLKFTSAVDS